MSVFDQEHSDHEERWISIGQASDGEVLGCCPHSPGACLWRNNYPNHFSPPRNKAGEASVQRRLMKKEYDFSKGERGKFYRPDATLELPIYLEKDVWQYLSRQAAAKGIEVETLVNQILRQDIALVEVIK